MNEISVTNQPQLRESAAGRAVLIARKISLMTQFVLLLFWSLNWPTIVVNRAPLLKIPVSSAKKQTISRAMKCFTS